MLFRVENISKSLGGQPVIDAVSFQAGEAELVSLVGPSGVGKTTLLTIIAGMERPDSGQVVFARPPDKRRPVILVFQDYLLFPSMTARDNVAFGPRAQGRGRAEARRKADELLGHFGLAAQSGQYPAQLSAGQRQRVALARALAVEPAVLLLDEPFANLDRNLKLETARFLRSTQRNFGIAMLCVTHDLDEAFAMSDRMGVMLPGPAGGRLVEFATAQELYHRPATIEAARFLGPVNAIPPALLPLLGAGPAANGRVRHARPEALSLAADPGGAGVVRDKSFGGHHVVYTVTLAGSALTVYSLQDGLNPGDRVSLRLTGELLSDLAPRPTGPATTE